MRGPPYDSEPAICYDELIVGAKRAVLDGSRTVTVMRGHSREHAAMANQRLKFTGTAVLFSNDLTSKQAGPAT